MYKVYVGYLYGIRREVSVAVTNLNVYILSRDGKKLQLFTIYIAIINSCICSCSLYLLDAVTFKARSAILKKEMSWSFVPQISATDSKIVVFIPLLNNFKPYC